LLPESLKPKALNTPTMLRLASDCLGFNPVQTLDAAEELYLAEVISYPRSESDAYDPEEDLEAVVQSLRHDPLASKATRAYAHRLSIDGLHAPRQDGHQHGDHNPVMPGIHDWDVDYTVRPSNVSHDAHSLYDLIARVFLASVSPDAEIEQTSLLLDVPFEGSVCVLGRRVGQQGWIEVMPIVSLEETPLPAPALDAIASGQRLTVQHVSVVECAKPQEKVLKESDLLAQMDAHGIGTDASMAIHIQKIIERNYIKVVQHDIDCSPPGSDQTQLPEGWFRTRREMHATSLGSILFSWYVLEAPEMAFPTVRAEVEEACLSISRGEQDPDQVLSHFLRQYKISFRRMFHRSNARTGAAGRLIRFLKMSPDRRNQDVNWKRAQRLICETDYDAMAKARQAALFCRKADSEPGEADLQHCLMPDAEVLDSNNQLLQVRALKAGHKLAAVIEHQGRLVKGFATVKAVRFFQQVERDVTSLSVEWPPHVAGTLDDHIAVMTSNHSLLAKHPHGIGWDRVSARDLVPPRQVVTSLVQTYLHQSVGEPCAHAIKHNTQRRKSCRVVEIELTNGAVALWLKFVPNYAKPIYQSPVTSLNKISSTRSNLIGVIASYGEFSITSDTRRRKVAIWGFSRAPKQYHQCLTDSPFLEECRDALIRAGFSFRQNKGYMFVRPSDVRMVQETLSCKGILLRSCEVLVAPEYETRLEQALNVSGHFYRSSVSHLSFESALDNLLHYRNAQPFQYYINGRHIQGRRTFIDVVNQDDQRSTRTAQTWP
jgi:hypothetical protein